jgi:hypothetical protein
VQSIATSTSQLVNAAKAAASNPSGTKDQLMDTQTALNTAVDSLSGQEWAVVVSDKAQKLITVAREASTATTSMVEISKNVLKQPTNADAKNELSVAARNVGAAIKVRLRVLFGAQGVSMKSPMPCIFSLPDLLCSVGLVRSS